MLTLAGASLIDAASVVLRGRSAEVGRAQAVLRAARKEGRGEVLVLSGEAGIGKSALLTVIRERAESDGFAVGFARATPVDDVAAGALVMLAMRSGAVPLLDSSTYLELAAIYNQRLWLADRIADALEARAQRQPVLITLDDFQFADPLSHFLVRALCGRLAGSPIVWAIARRGTWIEAAEDVAAGALDAHMHVEHLALGPLATDDVLALATDIVGRPLSAEAPEQLRPAAGNPLVAAQLAAEIATGSLDADLRMMPTSFLMSLRGRTRTLVPNTVELLHLTAVWGRALTLGNAAEVLGLVSTQEVLDRARGAVTQGLISIASDTIDFRHDLIRDFYCDGLSRSAKIDLHRRCAAFLLAEPDGSAIRAAPHAQACARLGDTGTQAILLAAAEQCVTTLPHVAAGLAQDAFARIGRDDPNWQIVGERCVEILVQAQHGADAVQLVDELQHATLRGPFPGTSEPDRNARLQVIAARALWLTGDLNDLVERVDSALAREGIPRALVARLTAAKALAQTRVESATAATATAQRALRMNRLDDAEVVSVAGQALGHAARNEGRYEQAQVQFNSLRTRFGPQFLSSEIMSLQSLDRYQDAQALLDEAFRGGTAHSDTALPDLLVAQQWQEWHLGRLDDAVATAQTVVRLSEELGNHSNKIEGWILLSIYAVLHKQFDRATELMHQATHFGSHEWALQPEIALFRGYLDAATGDVSAAVAVLGPLVGEATKRHHFWPRSQEWPRLLAGAAVAGSDPALAAQCVAQADLFAQRNPTVATIVGIAAQTRGFVDHDLKALQNAATILAEAPRAMLHARARLDLGYALLDEGQRRHGSRELEHALSIYELLGLPFYTDQVQATLDDAGHARHQPQHLPRPQFGWDALTHAERNVARKVAAGATNRAVAEELDVSVHTVNTHLRSIFAKLDLHSRVQLANAWNARPIHHDLEG